MHFFLYFILIAPCYTTVFHLLTPRPFHYLETCISLLASTPSSTFVSFHTMPVTVVCRIGRFPRTLFLFRSVFSHETSFFSVSILIFRCVAVLRPLSRLSCRPSSSSSSAASPSDISCVFLFVLASAGGSSSPLSFYFTYSSSFRSLNSL